MCRTGASRAKSQHRPVFALRMIFLQARSQSHSLQFAGLRDGLIVNRPEWPIGVRLTEDSSPLTSTQLARTVLSSSSRYQNTSLCFAICRADSADLSTTYCLSDNDGIGFEMISDDRVTRGIGRINLATSARFLVPARKIP